MTLAVPYPARTFERGQAVQLLPGEYEREGPPAGVVVLERETAGRVDGWRYAGWAGGEPVGVVVYVEV